MSSGVGPGTRSQEPRPPRAVSPQGSSAHQDKSFPVQLHPRPPPPPAPRLREPGSYGACRFSLVLEVRTMVTAGSGVHPVPLHGAPPPACGSPQPRRPTAPFVSIKHTEGTETRGHFSSQRNGERYCHLVDDSCPNTTVGPPSGANSMAAGTYVGNYAQNTALMCKIKDFF